MFLTQTSLGGKEMLHFPAVSYYVNNIFKCKYPNSRDWNGPPQITEIPPTQNKEQGFLYYTLSTKKRFRSTLITKSMLSFLCVIKLKVRQNLAIEQQQNVNLQ